MSREWKRRGSTLCRCAQLGDEPGAVDNRLAELKHAHGNGALVGIRPRPDDISLPIGNVHEVTVRNSLRRLPKCAGKNPRMPESNGGLLAGNKRNDWVGHMREGQMR